MGHVKAEKGLNISVPSRARQFSALLLIIGLSLLFFAVPRFSSAQSQDNASDVVQLLRSRQYAAAEQAAERLLATAPQDCRLLSLRGLALNGLERASAAKQSF